MGKSKESVQSFQRKVWFPHGYSLQMPEGAEFWANAGAAQEGERFCVPHMNSFALTFVPVKMLRQSDKMLS